MGDNTLTEVKSPNKGKEKSDSEMDTSLTEGKLSKKEKKKKRKSLAVNGESPQTPVQKEKTDPNKTPKPKETKIDKTPGKLDKTPKSQEKVETPGQSPKVSKSGVLVDDLVIGTGQVAKNGKMVSVYYEGRLKTTKKVFD